MTLRGESRMLNMRMIIRCCRHPREAEGRHAQRWAEWHGG